MVDPEGSENFYPETKISELIFPTRVEDFASDYNLKPTPKPRVAQEDGGRDEK